MTASAPAALGPAGILLALGLFAPSSCIPEGERAREAEGSAEREGVGEAGRPALRFRQDGTFRIVQFTDTQDDHEIDPRTVRLMEAVLDHQSPDLVVFTGDNIRAGPETMEEAHAAMDHIVRPVESRGIPWILTFGNHDEDHTASTGMDAEGMLRYYTSFPKNLNRIGPADVHGTGNGYLLIRGSTGEAPRMVVWILDSGRYVSDSIGGQALGDDGLRSYDWIRASQVSWYVRTSLDLEGRYGRPIPALMFFHIPIPEFALMWEHRDNHNVTGERNEGVAAPAFNSGLFAAILERGDVMGVFVGHDHVNDYVGDYFGVRLGYAANTGFGTYGLEGEERDRMRGARTFLIREGDPGSFETRMVYARDFGF
jgi:3',5'-cyclic AMP phosphodiesterase CpdA